MSIGNAGLRMHGCLLHIECDENDWECPSAVHPAILPAMRE
jgi:hypothetical protein